MKKKKWIKLRHKIATKVLSALLAPYTRWKYGISVERLPKTDKAQYLILYNHQTGFDQFFVGIAARNPVYYLATEDIFSMGMVSSLIRFLVAPIPIKKQTTDLAAVMSCIRVAREGGSLAIAPEGNRTYSGKTEYINPAIAALARKLQLPIAFFRIEGGYGVQPRWSDTVRKGTMRAYFSRILPPEEYAGLDNQQLHALICKELDVNEAVIDGLYTSKRSAEYLERALYICPHCGLSVLESNGNIIRCTKCSRQVRYLPTKELAGIDFDLPFRFVNDWYAYQKDFVSRLNPNDYLQTPLYSDTVDVYKVTVYKKKNILHSSIQLSLYGDRIVWNENESVPCTLSFDTLTAVSVLGKNKLNLYHNDQVYQIKGGKRFNALKYVNFYYQYKNIKKGVANGKFLGL